MAILSNFTIPLILFAISVLSGIFLSRLGKPLNGFVFNIHKLIALAGVVLGMIEFIKLNKSVEIQSLLVILLILGALCILAIFTTGAVMSMDKTPYELFETIHKIATGSIMMIIVTTAYVLITIFSNTSS